MRRTLNKKEKEIEIILKIKRVRVFSHDVITKKKKTKLKHRANRGAKAGGEMEKLKNNIEYSEL